MRDVVTKKRRLSLTGRKPRISPDSSAMYFECFVSVKSVRPKRQLSITQFFLCRLSLKNHDRHPEVDHGYCSHHRFIIATTGMRGKYPWACRITCIQYTNILFIWLICQVGCLTQSYSSVHRMTWKKNKESPKCIVMNAVHDTRCVESIKYHEISNIRRTKSHNLNVSRLVLQLSLPNPLKPGVMWRMKM